MSPQEIFAEIRERLATEKTQSDYAKKDRQSNPVDWIEKCLRDAAKQHDLSKETLARWRKIMGEELRHNRLSIAP